jgi:hypothetical protein
MLDVRVRRTSNGRRRQLLFRHRVEWRICSLQLGFERSSAGRRCRSNPRAQLVPLLRPVLTPMYVAGVMACTA